MARLIQGDVGSGKTIVAILALVHDGSKRIPGGADGADGSACTAALRSHVQELLEEHGIRISVPVLLTGSMTAKEKRLAHMQKIEITRQASVIIGTHALIQEKVKYHSSGACDHG